MQLAWPRLANGKTATAIVVDKNTRTKVATTSAIDREQTFRCMTRPQGSQLECSMFGAATAFQRINVPSRGLWLIVAVGLQCQTKREVGRRTALSDIGCAPDRKHCRGFLVGASRGSDAAAPGPSIRDRTAGSRRHGRL